MFKILLFALLLMLSFSTIAQQPGSLDVTYGNGGISATAPNGTGVGKIIVQSNGKIVTKGNAETDYYENDILYQNYALIRYTVAGAIDKTFGGNGVVLTGNLKFSFTTSTDIAVQNDGKVLIAGSKETPDYQSYMAIYRYNANGTRDNNFYIEEQGISFPTGSAPIITVQSDGKIVVAAAAYGENIPVFIYNPDGSKHSTTYLPLPETGEPKLFLSAYTEGGGYVISYPSGDESIAVYSSRFGLKQFVAASTAVDEVFYRHAILKNNKIAVLGNYNQGQLMMLNANGSLDAGYDADGYLVIEGEGFFNVVSEPNGTLIINHTKQFKNGFSRYYANGTIDNNFGENGFAPVVNSYSDPLVVYGNRLFATGHHTIAAYLLNTDPRSVKVNLHGNTDPYNHGEWNNWNNLKNLHFNNFYYADSTASDIDAVMSNRTGINDNGANYGGSATLMAPKGVLRHSSYSISPRTVTFSGLTTSKKYDVEFYASRNDYSGNNTVFTVNGVMKSVSTYRNFSQKVIFENLTPDAQGKIVINLKSSKTYNYLNGFILTEKFNTTTTAVSSNAVTEAVAPVSEKTAPTDLIITAFPNPTSGYFTLQFKGSLNETLQVIITDATGKVIEQKAVAAATTFTIGQNYKPGVYFVQVRGAATYQVLKLIKN